MARPLLDPDPAPAVLRWGWFLWLSWSIVGIGLLGEDRNGSGFALGLVLSAPFWALWLLWPVYRGWSRWMLAVRRERRPPWQRITLEFEGRPVRVHDDGTDLWVDTDDAFDAIGLPAADREPERERLAAEDGGGAWRPGAGGPAVPRRRLAEWLEQRSEPDALRFRRWMEGQTVESGRREDDLQA